MDFAIRHKDWTLEDWKRVVWSDETKINCLSSGEILKILMVCHHINQSWRSLKVVAPYLKSFEDGEQFLVVDIIVEFGGHKGAGVESDGVDFIVHWGYHGENGSEGVVQRICFDYEWRAWNPVC